MKKDNLLVDIIEFKTKEYGYQCAFYFNRHFKGEILHLTKDEAVEIRKRIRDYPLYFNLSKQLEEAINQYKDINDFLLKKRITIDDFWKLVITKPEDNLDICGYPYEKRGE